MRTMTYFRSSALAASLVFVAMACSDEESPGVPGDSPLTDVDSGVDADTSVDAAADAVDAPIDAAAALDADGDSGDAAPPTCTDENWCHTPIAQNETLRDIWGDGSGVFWTVSSSTGNVLYWDGAAWNTSFTAGTPLYAIWGSGPNDIWVGGDGGFFHGTGTSPSTMSWTPVSAGGAPIRSIWGRSASDIWAVGYTGSTSSFTAYVQHYTGTPLDADAGTGWSAVPGATASPARFTKVWGTPGQDEIWIGGQTGTTNEARAVCGKADGAGGYTWTLSPPAATGRYFNGAGFLTPSVQVILGFDVTGSSVYGTYTGVRDDSGVFSWTRFDGFNRGNAQLNAVGGTGLDDVWVAGAYGRLRHWDGTEWHVARTALDDVMPVVNTLYGMWVVGMDDVWVVGNGIALHKSPAQN